MSKSGWKNANDNVRMIKFRWGGVNNDDDFFGDNILELRRSVSLYLFYYNLCRERTVNNKMCLWTNVDKNYLGRRNISQSWEFCSHWYRLEREEKKWYNYSTLGIHIWSFATWSANLADKINRALSFRRDVVLSSWYSDSTLNTKILFLKSVKRPQRKNKKQNLEAHTW